MAEQKALPSVVEYLTQREQKLDSLVDLLSSTNPNGDKVKLVRAALVEIRHALLIAELNEPETKEN